MCSVFIFLESPRSLCFPLSSGLTSKCRGMGLAALLVLKPKNDVMRLVTTTTPLPRLTSEPLHGALSAMSDADGVDGDRDADGCKQIESIVFGGKLDQALSCRINQCIKTNPTRAFTELSNRCLSCRSSRKFVLQPAEAAEERKTFAGFPQRGNFLRQPHQLQKGEQPQPRGSLQRRAKGVFANVVIAENRLFISINYLRMQKCTRI